jgi:NitT/TauT family transport system substrate-binding protein
MTETSRALGAALSALHLGLAFVLTQGFAACAALAAEPAPKLTISYSEKVGDELPLWIAADAGYFKRNGLDVTLRYLPAQEGIPALLTGQIQMASIGGADVLSAAAQGPKLKFVAGATPVFTFQLWAQPKHASAKGLRGQRVGVPSTTGALYTGTVLALRQLGLKPSDVAITSLGSVPNVNNALLAGSIVAAASHPPATYYFKEHGLIEMVDLPHKGIPSIIGGLVAKESYIKAQPMIVGAAVDAIVEAIHREKTDKAFSETELSKYIHITQQAALDFTYDFYTKEAAPSAMPKASELKVAQEALSATNLKVKNLDLASLIDQSFVKAAEQRMNVQQRP